MEFILVQTASEGWAIGTPTGSGDVLSPISRINSKEEAVKAKEKMLKSIKKVGEGCLDFHKFKKISRKDVLWAERRLD